MFGRYIFFTECVHLFFGMFFFFRILLLQLFCFCCVFSFAYTSAVFSHCAVFFKLCFCAFHFVCSSLLLLFFCFGNCFAFCFLFLLTFLALVSPSVHVSPFLASHRFFALLLFLLFCACVAFPCFSLLLSLFLFFSAAGLVSLFF